MPIVPHGYMAFKPFEISLFIGNVRAISHSKQKNIKQTKPWRTLLVWSASKMQPSKKGELICDRIKRVIKLLQAHILPI